MAKKSLARKIMLSIFAGAVLFSNSIVWAADPTLGATKDDEEYTITLSDSTTTVDVLAIHGSEQITTSATGSNSMALGGTASGQLSIAIGRGGTTASNYSAIAVGTASTAAGHSSIAMGYAAEANSTVDNDNTGAIAIGGEAKADAQNAIAFGRSSTVATGAFWSTAIGYKSISKSTHGVAIGPNATVGEYASGSLALGTSAQTSGSSAIAIGDSSNGGASNVIAIGNTSKGSADDAIAIGRQSNAAGNYSVGIGLLSSASESGAIAIGYSSSGGGSDVIAIGSNSTATNTSGIAIGAYSSNLGYRSVALGSRASIAENIEGAVAIGYESEATQENTVSVGNATTQRKIVYVADTNIDDENNGYDAVNVNTLKTALADVGGLDSAVTKVEFDEDSGELTVTTTTKDDTASSAIVDLNEWADSKYATIVSVGELTAKTGGISRDESTTTTTISDNLVVGKALTVNAGISASGDVVATVDSQEYSLKETAEALTGKADKAITLAGYGITNAFTKDEVNSTFATIANVQTVIGLSGLSADAVTAAYTDTNYINKATSLTEADKALDTELKKVSDSVSGLTGVGGAVTDLQASVTALNSTVADHTDSITTLSSTINSHAESITAINNSIGNIGALDGLATGIAKGSIIAAINSVYEEAKKHTTVSAGNGVTVTGTNSGGSTETTATSETTSTTTGTGGTNYEVSANIEHVGDANITVSESTDASTKKTTVNVSLKKDITVDSVTVNGGKGSTVIDGDNITFQDSDGKEGTTITNNSVTTTTVNATTANITEKIVVGTDETKTTISNKEVVTETVNATNVTSNNVTVNNKFVFVDGENVTTTIDKDGMTTNNATVNNTFIVGDTKNEYTEIKGDTVTITNQNGSTTIEGDTINSTTINLGDNVTVNNEGMTIKGDTTNVIINEDGITFGGDDNTASGPSINNNGMDMNNTTISNVKDGEVSATSKDAVNGSQLYQEATERMIADQKLNSRLNKVGAGAAALAALHPLDFDPDDKLSFSAGVGNYAGENAAALGMFYRPNEKVMLSMGGTMGNGENMVNMGITFALDKPNNVSNSRVAMAKEIVAMREHIAKQDAQIAQLVMLVNQLTGNVAQQEATTAFSPSGRVRVERLTDGYEEYDRVKIEKGAELDGDNSKTVEAK